MVNEIFYVILTQSTTNLPTTTPILSDYPDNLPLYNKSHNYPEVKEPAPKQGHILKSVVNYQLMSPKGKNDRVFFSQMSSAP